MKALMSLRIPRYTCV